MPSLTWPNLAKNYLTMSYHTEPNLTQHNFIILFHSLTLPCRTHKIAPNHTLPHTTKPQLCYYADTLPHITETYHAIPYFAGPDRIIFIMPSLTPPCHAWPHSTEPHQTRPNRTKPCLILLLRPYQTKPHLTPLNLTTPNFTEDLNL